jgi:putative pyruvate formate lyase activating enzyme
LEGFLLSLCSFCPRNCAAQRTPLTGSGFCGMGLDPVIARAAPHFWEEPCISGTRGSGTVFFTGCVLRCAYCQNGEISHRRLGRHITVQELADIFKSLEDEDVHNINLVTPTHFIPAILDALTLYRPRIPIVWNTGGYEKVESLRLLEGAVDVYLPDLKHFSPAMGKLCAGAPDYFEYASKAIIEMCRQTGPAVYDAEGIMQKGTLVRHLCLPGLTGESINLLDWIAENLPGGTPVSLMRQYVPMNGVNIPGLDRRITEKEYKRVRGHMIALGLPGYEQEAAAADAAYVPPFEGE